VHLWNRATLKSLTVPGGVLLLGIAVFLHAGWLTLALPALSFLYDCAIIGGMLLAWRFHSSRVFFAILVLFLAQQAIALNGGSQASVPAQPWGILNTAAVLVPLNFVLIALMRERGFTVSGIAPFGLFLFVQTVVVAVLSLSAQGTSLPSHTHQVGEIISLPGYVLLAFAATGVLLLVRAIMTRKPADSALLWSLACFFLALHFNGSVRFTTVYFATAMCILATSIIENSYLLAYHDELTTLPSRRAFNDAVLRLQDPFSIAAVDIDHFKRFNDTYGHDTGDQVLRLVASKLARVTGGGQAYRCGGEEFVILFPGKTTAEVVDHLEQLRARIEGAEFRQRGQDRRQVPRGPDRRNDRSRDRSRERPATRQLARDNAESTLSVTVSIGVAGSSDEDPLPDLVLEAADKALYRAKANGRNRLETSSSTRRGSRRTKAAGIAQGRQTGKGTTRGAEKPCEPDCQP
jgi:diguanylate cyclase (GGDEF)-like protein